MKEFFLTQSKTGVLFKLEKFKVEEFNAKKMCD